MSFVIYHKETTLILQEPGKRWYNNTYETEAAAKAGLTRAIKKSVAKSKLPAPKWGKKSVALKREDYAISDTETFHKHIEKKVEKRNLMSGKPIMVAVNEPLCTDPSSETYWSM